MTEPRRGRRPSTKGVLTASAILLAGGILILLLGDSLLLDVFSAGLIAAAWSLPALLVTRQHARAAAASKTDLDSAQRSIVKTVVDKIEETRAKQSRHEYHQERSLERIEIELRRFSAGSAPEPLLLQGTGIDVLFVTSNGAGLGHVTRLMAIAQYLPSTRRVECLTMSTAYRQVAGKGVTIHYFPSSEAAGESPEKWNPIFRGYFRALLERIRPRVVVFDGTWVYTGITDVCRALGVPLVWVQRGLWKPEVDAASVQRHDARSVADEVIVPGDYAGPEEVDAGAGIEPHHVGPIVMTDRNDLFSRNDACARLGLDSSGRYALLNLGGGAISAADSLTDAALRTLQEHFPEVTPVQVVSPLASRVDEVPGLRRISAYPVMPFARAFDVMIAAAGYNSAQEAIALGIPSILVPNPVTRTDDQVRRARDLGEQGLCLLAEGPEELQDAVRSLARDEVRQSLSDRLAAIEAPRGAFDAAEFLESICVRAEWLERVDTLNSTGATMSEHGGPR